MKVIGKIDLSNFVGWCEEMDPYLADDPYKSGIKRKVAVIGNGIDYFSVDGKKKLLVVDGLKIKKVEDFIRKVDDYQDWSLNNDLCLLLKYQKGGGIKMHRDSSGYGKMAAIVSSSDYEFNHGGKKYDCKAGLIYQFDSKVLHGVKNCKDRWSLAWWMLDERKVNEFSLF